MHTRKLTLAELRAKCGGREETDFTITAASAEEEAHIRNDIAYREGRFSTLTPEAQETCHWRAAAVIYALDMWAKHRAWEKTSALEYAAAQIGCSSRMLFRLLKLFPLESVGEGYWHLYVIPARKKDHSLASQHPKVWIKINELLRQGQRPSLIVARIKAEMGFDVSARTVQRIAVQESGEGRLERTKFINRFGKTTS